MKTPFNKVKFFFSAVLFLAMALGLAMSTQTARAATTWNVPGDSTNTCTVANPSCSTIQGAVNAAFAFDTINVAAGTYAEQITISKALTIIGSDGAVLDGTTLGSQKVGVKIKSGNVTFDNIDVEHFSGNGIIVGYEASIPGSLQNVHITNCKISSIQPGYSHGFGIYVGYQSEDFKRPLPTPKLTAHLDYSGLLIENNEITDSRSSALVLQSITGTPGTLMVRNNYIHDNDNDGIWIDSARNINIEGNTVVNNPDGVYISSYGDAFQGVIGGQWVYDWSNQQLNGPYGPMNISITGNTIVDNNTYGGIYLAAGYPATILINENNITGNLPEGVANYLSEQVNATCNWWGAANGPGTVGAGDGDKVSEYVTFLPWLVGAAPGGACGGGLTFSVAASVTGGNGSVDPATQTVDWNTSASISITPELGYHIATITDNLIAMAITNPYMISNVTDNHTVVVTFAPTVPETKEKCMNNGWKSVRRANGSPFKNQGDCIQYVNTGK